MSSKTVRLFVATILGVHVEGDGENHYDHRTGEPSLMYLMPISKGAARTEVVTCLGLLTRGKNF